MTVAAGRSMGFDELTWRAPRQAARGSIERSFADALFASAYGAEYYRGFVDRTGGLAVEEVGAVPDRVVANGLSTASIALLGAGGVLAAGALVATGVRVQAGLELDGDDRWQVSGNDAALRGNVALGIAIGAGVAGVGAHSLRRRTRRDSQRACASSTTRTGAAATARSRAPREQRVRPMLACASSTTRAGAFVVWRALTERTGRRNPRACSWDETGPAWCE